MKKSTSRPKPRRPVAKGANKAHAGAASGGLKESSRAMRKEMEELRRRLEIAEMTLNAIRSGEADALVISGPDGDRVFTLKGADQPYRVLVETMNEGAVTVTPDGVVLYSNRHFADLLGRPLENVMGASLYDVVPMGEHGKLDALLRQGETGAGKTELTLSGPRGAISAQLSATAIQVDALAAVCIVVTDLTERRHSEELIASENLARSILE